MLVGGATAGAVAATRGPTAGQARAKAAKVEVDHQAQVRTEQAQLLAGVQIFPASGATQVPLDSHVIVSTTDGMLQAVTVNAPGGSIPGAMDAKTGNRWVSGLALQPSTTYTVTAKLMGVDGTTAAKQTTFTTLTPVAQVTATVWPTTGAEVGVGQPIVVNLDHDIDSAAAQKGIVSHFTVAMSAPVPGGWYWFSPHEVHFRPKTYWPAHEQVSVTGDLGGWNAGEGRWGAGVISDAFTVGDARISYANLATHEMTVTYNGATVASYPISGGRDKYPTMAGDHIVLDRESVVHMVSSTVGIPVNSPDGYDEYVYDDVHISDSGEYVHAAPWSVGAQGFTNVSHGCINLSSGNALTFYNFSRVGDVVEVTGSPRPPAVGDHGVMDWSTPWSQWIPGRVTHLVGTVAPPTTTSTTAAPYHAPAVTTPVTSPPTTVAATTTVATTTPTTRATTTTSAPGTAPTVRTTSTT